MQEKPSHHSGPQPCPQRSPTFGMISGVAEEFDRQTSLELFRRICLIRHFEFCVLKAHQSKQVECLIYLGIGQECTAAAASIVMEGSYMLAQHRSHASYLAFGGDPVKLIDELLGLPTGCNQGMGGSNSNTDIEKRIIGHNQLIGDNVPIGIGMAFAAPPGQKVVCMVGDGAMEEDYVLGALGFAGTHKLPILLMVEDNDLSVLTPTIDRRTWKIDEVSRAFEIPAVDITDDPWLILHHVKRFSTELPALINVRACREYWHQGSGQDGPPEWNRFELVKEQMRKLGLEEEAKRIEAQQKAHTEGLWKQRLQIRFGS